MYAEGYLKAGDLTASERAELGEPEYYWTWPAQSGQAEIHFYDEARVANPVHRRKDPQRLIGASEASKPPYLTKTLLSKFGDPAQVILVSSRGETVLYRPDVLKQLSNPEIDKLRQRREDKAVRDLVKQKEEQARRREEQAKRKEAAKAQIVAKTQASENKAQGTDAYFRLARLAAPNFVLIPQTQFYKGDFRFGVAYSSAEHLEIVREVCDRIGVPLSDFGNTGKWSYIAKDADSLELLLEEANECLSNLAVFLGEEEPEEEAA